MLLAACPAAYAATVRIRASPVATQNIPRTRLKFDMATNATIASELRSLAWNLPAADDDQPSIRTHVIHGTPPSLTEIIPLQLENLQPANMTKPVLMEFLQSQLKTRAATQKAVHAVVLSAPYLPSQVDTISDLAAKSGLQALCFISKAELHTVVLRLPVFGWTTDQPQQQQQPVSAGSANIPPEAAKLLFQLLNSTFGNIAPLSPDTLAAARSTEQTLNRQLRLWHPPTWAETLQQQLLSRKAIRPVLAIRSLMGPPSLQEVRKLVTKQGLFLAEEEVDEQRYNTAALSQAEAGSSNSNTSSLGSRRRPSRSSSATNVAVRTSAGGGAEPQAVGLLLAIFKSKELAEQLPVSQLPPEVFTDYVLDRKAAGSVAQQGGGANVVEALLRLLNVKK